jgi:hypothetical protein
MQADRLACDVKRLRVIARRDQDVPTLLRRLEIVRARAREPALRLEARD